MQKPPSFRKKLKVYFCKSRSGASSEGSFSHLQITQQTLIGDFITFNLPKTQRFVTNLGMRERLVTKQKTVSPIDKSLLS